MRAARKSPVDWLIVAPAREILELVQKKSVHQEARNSFLLDRTTTLNLNKRRIEPVDQEARSARSRTSSHSLFSSIRRGKRHRD